jgi:acyl-CoA hydrolase
MNPSPIAPPADVQLRFIDETEVQLSELMTPNYENFSGKVHGGVLLSLMDKAAYVCASRFAGGYCVTVAVDRVEFREPVHVGELLQLTARVVLVGHSSMDIQIELAAMNLEDGTSRRTNTCYFTMVALRDGKPRSVPRLAARNPEDEQRMAEARLYRELRTEFRRRLATA